MSYFELALRIANERDALRQRVAELQMKDSVGMFDQVAAQRDMAESRVVELELALDDAQLMAEELRAELDATNGALADLGMSL